MHNSQDKNSSLDFLVNIYIKKSLDFLVNILFKYKAKLINKN